MATFLRLVTFTCCLVSVSKDTVVHDVGDWRPLPFVSVSGVDSLYTPLGFSHDPAVGFVLFSVVACCVCLMCACVCCVLFCLRCVCFYSCPSFLGRSSGVEGRGGYTLFDFLGVAGVRQPAAMRKMILRSAKPKQFSTNDESRSLVSRNTTRLTTYLVGFSVGWAGFRGFLVRTLVSVKCVERGVLTTLGEPPPRYTLGRRI